MYRLLLTILLCLRAATSAPQGKESDVTYVKIQPVVEDTPADTTSARESRIEKLPLTFPGNFSTTDSKEPDKNLSEKSESKQAAALSENTPESKTLSENQPDLTKDRKKLSKKQSDLSESLDLSETSQSETFSDPNGADETNTTDDLSEISPSNDLTASNTDQVSDTVPSETGQTDRRSRTFDSVQTTETSADGTEKYGLIDTLIDAPRTKAPAKFVPKLPKSSYYTKPRLFQTYSANRLEIIGNKKFRSTCSCQKIWNCPKLQITIPRCPDEYFLCCL